MSRNKREGRYAGWLMGRHRRASPSVIHQFQSAMRRCADLIGHAYQPR